MLAFRKFRGEALVNCLSLRRHHHDALFLSVRSDSTAAKIGSGFITIPWPAAEWRIIDDVVFVRGPIAQIMNVQVERATFLRALHHAFARAEPDRFREKREDIDAHKQLSTSIVERQSDYNLQRRYETRPLHDTERLLYDFERRLLSVARGGTGKQRTDRLNGLPVPADDPADIALAHLQPENGHLARRNFRQHDSSGNSTS